MAFYRVSVAGFAGYVRSDDGVVGYLWTAAPWDDGEESERTVDLSEVALLPPVAPSKIVCIGRNYRLHAEELGNVVPKEPLLFLKPPSALLGDGGAIVLPPESDRVEHEGELGVVIGQRLYRASPERCLAGIFGLTCVNDVTARDLQRRDVQFTRGKGFDTFCPVGPAVVPTDPLADRQVTVSVGGEVRQRGQTADMEVSVPDLLAYISSIMTLEPGDLVATGTPAGVGPLLAGDQVTVEIEGVGRLTNRVSKLQDHNGKSHSGFTGSLPTGIER